MRLIELGNAALIATHQQQLHIQPEKLTHLHSVEFAALNANNSSVRRLNYRS